MAIRTELNLRLPNSPGALASVCRLLFDQRVNILAMTLEAGGQLRLVVDNHVHAVAGLRDHHYRVVEREVLVAALPNTPGALATTLKLVSDAGINLEYAYGSASEFAASATVVLGVDDAARASAATGI